MLVLLAALAALSSPPTAISPAELHACLGQDKVAASLETYAKMKAALSQAEWADACRQARDANARRQSLRRVIAETGVSPVPGFQSAVSMVAQAKKAKDPDAAQLFRLVFEDQIARGGLSGYKTPISLGLSPTARKLYDGLVAWDAVEADAKSREWLRATVARRGWFTIDRDGPAADAAAWLIVQHADEDLAFKREMIAIIEPLTASGQSRREPFPSMYDRWAFAAKEPQRFGLNGVCKGPGVWDSGPIEDPARIDERRAAFGLRQSFADYTKEMSARCP